MTVHAHQPLANAIRMLSIDAIVRANEGHQGVPLGMAEIATALYSSHLKFSAKNPTWWDRDRVVALLNRLRADFHRSN
jgi:transketolase